MKRTSITVALADFPEELHPWLAGASIYDSSCSRQARVLFIDREDGYFLKRAPEGTLEREALLNAYFHRKGLSAEVVLYLARRDGADWLLTRRVRGEDCTHATYLAEPRRLAVLLGERLRELHGESTAGCPVSDRMESYFATVRENFLGGFCDLSYFTTDYGDADAEQIYRIAQEGRTGLSSDTLLHGDYSYQGAPLSYLTQVYHIFICLSIRFKLYLFKIMNKTTS